MIADTTRAVPLRHFPFYSTRDFEVSRNVLSNYGVTDYDVIGSRSDYEYRVNFVQLRNMSLYHGSCSTGVHLKFSGVNFIRQRVCMGGNGRSSFGGFTTNLNKNDWSAVVPPDEGGHFEFEPGYKELRMVIDFEVLKRKLGALLGEAPADQIRFMPNNNVRSPGLSQYRRILSYLLFELDMGGPNAPSAVVNEIAEALLISYLHGQPHNFSHRLQKPELAPSSHQQRLAEDYIAASWNQALNIEEIAAAANVSARSIFRSFRQTHGCTPFEFLKRLRLENARVMLLHGEAEITVSGVAQRCGFHSLGHFSRSYWHAFGELPSETVRRSFVRFQ